jgi:prepilin-type N-terminal cleavage/methylation domain-containing protein
MQKRQNRGGRGFTLIEIMIVVTIIGLLVAIAVPNFIQARETSRSKSCVANLRQIDTAKQQYMMVQNVSTFANVTSTNTTLGGLVPTYVRSLPTCPIGGTYSTGTESLSPSCSLATSNASVYGQTGTYPHYLP